MKKFLFSLLLIIILAGILIVIVYYLLLARTSINPTSREEIRLTLKNPVEKKLPVRHYERIIKPIYQIPRQTQSQTTRQFNYISSSPPIGGGTKESKTVTNNEPIETTPPPEVPESLLKYVLFSINYDPVINAGETESLRLTMSPRNKLANLEQALKEGKIRKNQINDIEKLQTLYKYVSVKLLVKDHCLHIQKMMPEEDKVYLHSVNQTPNDQIWQWDLTAPLEPTVSTCQLSIFIRFCPNLHDCIPTYDPDKKFNIDIHVKAGDQFTTWVTYLGNLAGLAISILTFIGIVAAWIWRINKHKQKPP